MIQTNIILSPIPLSELESAIAKTVEQLLDRRLTLTPVQEPDELITREETAHLLRVSLPTLHIWTKQGLIPFYKISTRVRYKRAEVLNLFENGSLMKFGRR
jgi:excisionase family DNA binding protein